MFVKLAARNVRRQIGNYLIYFITVALTVALMFAVNNVIYSEQLLAYAEAIEEMQAALIIITVFIAFIVAFVLGYATSFMLKLRKREFGTYLTLGMTRGNILRIFVLETMLLCLAALGAGIIAGLFLYQGMMAMMTHLLEMEFAFATYSVQGLTLTVALVLAMFVLSALTSALYLKRASIYHLLHGDRFVEKDVRHPFIWFALTVLSLGIIIGSCVYFDRELVRVFYDGTASPAGLLLSLVLLAVGIIVFHTGLSKSIVKLLLKNRGFRSRGTNTFTLRQLSAKLSANSVMAGILAFLISFAIIGANVSFVQRASERVSLDQQYPFDIYANLSADSEGAVSLDEALPIIRQYATINETIGYQFYTSGNGYLHSFTKWTGDSYDGLTDTFMSESDFNRLMIALGLETVQLNGTFLLCTNPSIPQLQQCDFSQAQLQWDGKTYSYGGKIIDVPTFFYVYFFAVVPDEVVETMKIESDCAAIDLEQERYDAYGLRQALSYNYTSDGSLYAYERCDFRIREYGRLERNSNSAILIIGVLYIAVIFVFMAMAVLALKTLAGLSDDQRRYEILYRLGAGEKEQSRALFHQTFSFFILPFALPILMSIPAGFICAHVTSLAGYASLTGEVYMYAAGIALVLSAVYLLYFTATYLIARKSIIQIRR